MKTEHRKSWRILISGLAFVLLVSAFFFVLIVRITPESLPSMSPDEIARLDLSAQTACIDRGDTQWYPGELLEPPDFALGEHAALRSDARFGTNRVVLSLPAGKTYGITGSSCSYAQKLWINGALVSQVGQVSDSPDGFVPRTDEYTVYFTPETDTTEIIVQRAHFNHRSGYFNKVYLAEEQIIAQRNRRQFISDGLMLGALLSIAIFFLGMVLFYTRRLSLLWFSLACLCSALHYMTFRGKAFALLFPDLSWYLSHKLEYLAQYSFY
ncbi:MAG: histidine kinase, partial [Clostridia bacterium]|nr:histidine kinase [Clostridia bacterium]